MEEIAQRLEDMANKEVIIAMPKKKQKETITNEEKQASKGLVCSSCNGSGLKDYQNKGSATILCDICAGSGIINN